MLPMMALALVCVNDTDAPLRSGLARCEQTEREPRRGLHAVLERRNEIILPRDHGISASSLIRNLCLDKLRQQHQRLLPAKNTCLRRDDIWQPLLHDVHLGPDRDLLQAHLTFISPGRFGSSNLSVQRIRSCGTSSRYSPPKEWLLPEVKLVNDILYVPPTRGSMWWTLPVKPFGGSHLAIASASRNAR